MASGAKVVMSLHGIKTRGVWQKDLAPELALGGYIPYVLDYGDFGALKLIRSRQLDKKVEWLVKEYDRISADSKSERPSLIAHSFGTLQVSRLLEKYDHVVFDKIILAASIIDNDYPWPHMLDAQRVNWVVNDYGGQDIWPKIARWFVPNAGKSGAEPFSKRHRALHQVEHPHHGHSDYFSLGNFRKNWVPTLQLDKRSIVDKLHALIGHLSKTLKLSRGHLRVFVLRPDENIKALRIEAGLFIGAATPREVSVTIPIDGNGVGSAPAIAYKEMREVRQSGDELKILVESFQDDSPLHADLKWSIALPIPVDGGAFEEACGVLVVDGLKDVDEGLLAYELLVDDDVFTVLIQLGVILSAS
jgi:pimeloyl-ACP methyl ester carboxylesterase